LFLEPRIGGRWLKKEDIACPPFEVATLLLPARSELAEAILRQPLACDDKTVYAMAACRILGAVRHYSKKSSAII
jgi:hypothetical protein